MKMSSSSELPPDAPIPRLCHLCKWPDFDGYGFNLHAEKQRPGQFIGKVDESSPAEAAGLREGDRIIEVNGVNIANENHKQVVERIKSIVDETRLLVVDEAADTWYKEHKIVVKSTLANVKVMKTPVSNGRPEANGKEPPNYENISPANGVEKDTITKNGIHESNVHSAPAKQEIKHVANGTSTEKKMDEIPKIIKESPKVQKSKDEINHSRSSTPQDSAASSLDSPSSTGSRSTNSAASNHNSATNNHNGPTATLEDGLLNLNMSASEMRQVLANRRKKDPKKEPMDIRQKYEIIQQM